jgi:hypothetical protein
MESEKLLKLAEKLRRVHTMVEQDKANKLASLVVTTTGLELLRRKMQG